MEIFKRQTEFDFMGKKQTAISLSAILILIGIVSVIIHGGLKYGIDFAGGTLVQLKFEKPPAIEEIRGINDEIIWSQKGDRPNGVRVISEENADTMNWMLRKVVIEGSGVAASIKNRQVAGKTGTSEGNRDLWFIGSIPQLTTTVWFGKDTNETTDCNDFAGSARFPISHGCRAGDR